MAKRWTGHGSLSCAIATTLILVLGACGRRDSTTARVPSVSTMTPPASSGAKRRESPAPFPLAARHPVVRDYFGTKVTDDYEWLEDGTRPEVVAFTEAQNLHTREWLDALTERPTIRTRVARILGTESPDYREIHAAGGVIFASVQRPPKQQPIVVVRDERGESERIVVDPNEIDPSGATTVDLFVPSPDGRLVAVSLSKGGSESGDLHVYDVATGKERSDVIPRVHGGTAGGSVAWSTDATALFYTRYPRAGERPATDLDFYQQVYFHKLGTPDAKDTYVFGKDMPRIAEIELERSTDGKNVLVHVANGDGGDVAHYVIRGDRAGAQAGTRIADFADEVSVSRFAPDGKIFTISHKGAPRGKVVTFSPPYDKPLLFSPESDAALEDVVVTSKAAYLIEINGGPSRIRRIPIGEKVEPLAREDLPKKRTKGTKSRRVQSTERRDPRVVDASSLTAAGNRELVTAAAELPIDPVSNVARVVRTGEDLLVRIESFVEMPAWYRYVATEHRLVKTTMAKAPISDLRGIRVRREMCVSKDGTRVPMTILHHQDAKFDGNNPTILYGYGGYDISLKPQLRKWMAAWLELSGVVAIANLRGGGEFGVPWHEAGKLTNKQNVFDDFAACAQTLGTLGVAAPAHLAAHGRSNGGLLMGAAIVQHPSLFRAVVSGVGIYDMLRVELAPNGAFNVTEFGTVKNEVQFRAMVAYSPYHHVVDGANYPAVLLMTGANDPRVDPYHSRKMAARLQAAAAPSHPILLRATADVGHGAGTPLSAEIEETADMLAFLAHELSMPVASTK